MTIPAHVAEAGAAFAFDGVPIAAERASGGHIHESWTISCRGRSPARRRYLLQRVNTSIFADPTALSANLAIVLGCLRSPLGVIPAQDGAPHWRSPSGGWWRAFDYVEGTMTVETVSSPAVATELGRAFGGFHRDTVVLDPDRLTVMLPGFHDPRARRHQLDRVVRADISGRVAMSGADLSLLASVDHVGEFASALTAPSLPRRVAHFDAKPSNVLFDVTSGQACCVIDLDTVMAGSWLWDVGDLIRSATCRAPEDSVDLDDVAIDLELYRALWSGYAEAVGPMLSVEERDKVATAGLVVTYEQAVRFLTDYLKGDTYYRIDRPTQNRDRFRAQVRLLQSMLGSRSAMIAM